MDEELISIIEVARIHKKSRQTVHKNVKRLRIDTVKRKGDGSRGQQVSCISLNDYEELKRDWDNQDDPRINLTNGDDSIGGVFYIVSLEPELDPGRIKVGFTTSISERLRNHQTAAPFSKVLRTWPCKSLWEKTAIDCVNKDCEKIHTEVFRTDDIENVVLLANKFFDLMPSVMERAAGRNTQTPD